MRLRPHATCLYRTLPTVLRKAGLEALILLLGGLIILPLHAQWAVVDSGAIAEITTVAGTVSQELQQLQQTYNLAQQMAQRATGMWRFQGPQNLWQDFQYADQYGTLAGWGAGLNSGNVGQIQSAYSQNTLPAGVNQSLTSLNSTMASTLKAAYSAQQILDGNNMAAMSTIGQIHASAAQYQNAIAALQTDDESDDPDLQSELAVEERTSNAAVLELHAQQDTNQLLSDLLQQQIAQNLIARGAMVSDSNANIDWINSLQTTAQTMTNSYGQSLQNWSISTSQ